MPKFFITDQNIQKDQIYIWGKDVNHLKNVLRKRVGEELVICHTQSGMNYLCEVMELNENDIKCKILKRLESHTEPNTEVTILQGLPKADKMEWVIQKAVELGVYDITPIQMTRCIVKLTEKEKTKKIQRWQKIAEVAAKQSGRDKIPQINEILSFKNICHLDTKYDIVIVAYENETENTLKQVLENLKTKPTSDLKIAIVIGPEGGITEEEIQMLKQQGAKIVTLGNRILRTETVALNILSIIMYELET